MTPRQPATPSCGANSRGSPLGMPRDERRGTGIVRDAARPFLLRKGRFLSVGPFRSGRLRSVRAAGPAEPTGADGGLRPDLPAHTAPPRPPGQEVTNG